MNQQVFSTLASFDLFIYIHFLILDLQYIPKMLEL